MKFLSILCLAVVTALATSCGVDLSPDIGNEFKTCDPGETCTCDILGNCYYDCPQGGCSYVCEGTGNCILNCDGGNCDTTCQGTGNCTLTCQGEGCSISCGGTGNCICAAGCD